METDATVTPKAGGDVVPMSRGLRILLGFVRMASFLLALPLTLVALFVVIVFGVLHDADGLQSPAVLLALVAACAYPVSLVVVMFKGERRWPWPVLSALACLLAFREAMLELEFVALTLLCSVLLLVVQVALTWTPSGWRTWQR